MSWQRNCSQPHPALKILGSSFSIHSLGYKHFFPLLSLFKNHYLHSKRSPKKHKKIKHKKPIRPKAFSSEMSLPPAARRGKLNGFLHSVLGGKKSLQTPKDGERFIEAICAQPDPPACLTSLAASAPHGFSSLQTCLRFKTDPVFLNGPAANLLAYLQAPSLKIILGGEFLRQTLEHIVDPPIFWDALVRAFGDGTLDLLAEQAFAWLLLELISMPTKSAERYYDLARETTLQSRLLNSSEVAIRTLGQRIKHVLSSLNTPAIFDGYGGPGGRHDNDFVDFRQIAILPTADELLSQEPAFLRRAAVLEDVDREERLGLHLDSQFRLLRDDMLSEMREEMSIALGFKKGKHRGVVIEGLAPLGIDFPMAGARLSPWCLKLQCQKDIPALAKFKDDVKRKKFLLDHARVLKHQSLACLIIDGEVVGFPTINRSEDLLASM